MNLKSLSIAAVATTATIGPAMAGPLTFEFLLIAEEGDPVVGAPGLLDGSYSDPAVDDAGNVAFQGGTFDAGGNPSDDDAVIVWSNGVLRQVHREDNSVPGTSVVDFNLDDHIEIRNGIAAFYGDADDTDSINFIATSDGTTSRIIVREGVTALPSAGSPMVSALSNTEGFGFDGVRTAFRARFDNNDDEGIYLDDGLGNLSLIADTNGTNPGGDAFTRLDEPMPDASGPGVVFIGRTADGDGVYVATDGTSATVTTVALLSDFPAVNADVDQVTIGEPDIDVGRVVFNTRQSDFDATFGTPEAIPAASIEFWDNGVLTTLIDEDTLLPNGDTPIDFSEVAIAGDYVAFGSQTDATGDSQNAIFLYDLRDDSLYTVVEIGDVIDGKTVTGIDAYNRPFLSDGFLALDLQFDGTANAIYRVAIIPEPTSLTLLGLGGLLVTRRQRQGVMQ